MNANKAEELANWLESGEIEEIDLQESATMLRQQQEQIENLKQWEKRQLDVIEQQQEEKKALYNLVAEQDKKIIDLAFKLAYAERSNEIVMEANEPGAWINRKGKDGEHGYLEWDKDDDAEINIPLYTHPAKTLTDEEIAQAWAETKGDILHRLMPFARSILKKASEK